MPYYDFRCHSCQTQFTLFYKSFSAYETSETHPCSVCGSPETARRIGRVALAKGDDARLDAMADDAFLSGVDENDPKSLGRFMRQMGNEMGEEMGEEFHEVVDRLESGQPPEEIEKSLPDIDSDGTVDQ